MAYFTWDMVGPNAIVRGDDLNLSFVWQRGVPLLPGDLTGTPPVPVDLTGYSGTFLVLAHYQDPTPYLSVPVSGLDATGSIQVNVPRASILALLPPLALVYQVVLVSPAGVTRTLLRGKAEVV